MPQSCHSQSWPTSADIINGIVDGTERASYVLFSSTKHQYTCSCRNLKTLCATVRRCTAHASQSSDFKLQHDTHTLADCPKSSLKLQHDDQASQKHACMSCGSSANERCHLTLRTQLQLEDCRVPSLRYDIAACQGLHSLQPTISWQRSCVVGHCWVS